MQLEDVDIPAIQVFNRLQAGFPYRLGAEIGIGQVVVFDSWRIPRQAARLGGQDELVSGVGTQDFLDGSTQARLGVEI
ncbi:hypothetical protein D3C85_245300 [compost metagenome]